MKAATRKDVANLAGVSVATVSYVLNRTKKVSPEVENRVREAAKALNYHPNYAARSLNTKRSMQVAILVDDLKSPYYAALLEGAQAVATKEGYLVSLLLSDSMDDDAIMRLISHQLDGIIVTTQKQDKVQKLMQLGIPCTGVEDRENSEVSVDYSDAIHEAIGLLYRLGHRKIAFLYGLQRTTNDERITDCKTALAYYGLEIDEDLIVWGREGGNTKISNGYEAMKDLLARENDFSAVFAINDLMAIGAMRCLKEHGFRLPQDVSIIGCDDIECDKDLTPTLSSIDISPDLFGGGLMKALLAKINHTDLDPLRIHARFIQRESIAQCRVS